MTFDTAVEEYGSRSLYSAIRLARLVQHIKCRLKSLIKDDLSSKKKSPGGHPTRVAKASELARQSCPTPPDAGRRILYQPRSTRLQLASLLRNVNPSAKNSQSGWNESVAYDSRLMKHDFSQVKQIGEIKPLRRLLELINILLKRRGYFRQDLNQDRSKCPPSELVLGVNDETFSERVFANLEHLLRYLKQIVTDAIAILCLAIIDANSQGHRDGAKDGWFAEWPNGQHPLNTTWPWNVKTSLLVIWGVCWMFYEAHNPTGSMYASDSHRPIGQDFRTRQPAPRSIQQPLTTTVALSDNNLVPIDPWAYYPPPGLHAARATIGVPGSRAQSAYATNVSTNSYIASLPGPTENLLPASLIEWPYESGTNVLGPSVDSNSRNVTTPWDPLINDPIAPTAITSDYRPGYPLPVTSASSQEHVEQRFPTERYTNLAVNPGSQFYPQQSMQNYPSPHSEISGPINPVPYSSNFGFPSRSTISPMMQTAKSPSLAGSSVSRQSSSRSAEPVRNAQGMFLCTHPDHTHQPSPPVFSRKCEWTKHMDKHTRPYACEEPGCENIRGFTYSGGLHRHQREVHGQHGGPKARCMCPHVDCKRSTGPGFSRRENLVEHLRRVHRGMPKQEAGKESLGELRETRKRRRKNESEDAEEADSGEQDQNAADLRLEVKKLRKELRERDERLMRLEEQMAQIRGPT